MGSLDRLSKVTFAAETHIYTENAVVWDDNPLKIPVTDIEPDGYLRVLRPDALGHLPWPWPNAKETDEIVLETKMAGDHSDAIEYERGLLRRQARQVQRAVEAGPKNVLQLKQSALWFVASTVPRWLKQVRSPKQVGPGCYKVESSFPSLWIAANELPLHDALVSFLLARTGRALVEFVRWVLHRRPSHWAADVVRYLPMSVEVRDLFLEDLATKSNDPELEARTDYMIRFLLDRRPMVKRDVTREAIDKGLAPLVRLLERRLARKLIPAERSTIAMRLDVLGPEQLGDLVIDLPTDKLAEWLASPIGV